MIRSWFINNDDGRLRAGWRILAFVLILAPIAVSAQMGIRAMLGGLPAGGPLSLSIIAVCATIAVFLARRFVDRKNFVSLGFGAAGSAWKDLLFGFALSGMMAACVLGLMVLFGAVENVQLVWAGWSTLALLLTLLFPNIVIGYWEELVFRGYLLQNMAEGLGPRVAIVVSCLLYGLLHSGNPNATIVSSLIIVIFGFLRIYGLIASGFLWLSMGMHIGWNYFQGAVFGFAASGHEQAQTLFTHEAASANWLSGGRFGPEGSVLIIPVLLLALLVMRAWSQRQGAPQPQVEMIPRQQSAFSGFSFRPSVASPRPRPLC